MKLAVLYNSLIQFLNKGTAFAAYSLPNTDDFTLITDLQEQINDLPKFAIIPFDNNENKISDSTSYDEYLGAFNQLINSLDNIEEKVVLSRIKNIESLKNPIDVAVSLFKQHCDCFNYIFYTTQYGLWFGATPEFLLKYNLTNNHFFTMALAGTRKMISEKDWDNKNLHEHSSVCSFIENALTSLNITYNCDPPTNVRYGDIEHLCHCYSGFTNVNPRDIIHLLNPTPAVCGFPREKALRIINEIEHHNRSCYSGLICLIDDNQLYAFVNLRCCNVVKANESYCYKIYAGGGVNLLSSVEAEWEESELKMKSIIRAVNA